MTCGWLFCFIRGAKSKKDSKINHFGALLAVMNDQELNHVLKLAMTAKAVPVPGSFETEIMARVRVDGGRARRRRSFVCLLLLLAAAAGVLTASVTGWSLAARDTTHTAPPVMNLFRETTTP